VQERLHSNLGFVQKQQVMQAGGEPVGLAMGGRVTYTPPRLCLCGESQMKYAGAHENGSDFTAHG
jgi:hypothetical protein